MARGGINKAVVQKARQALLARGANPSIDAVRVELGNTGSKTTISRYLKELEPLGREPAASRERLGDALTGMVQTLLDQVLEEGREAVSEATAAFELQRSTLESQIVELKAELEAAHRHSLVQQAAIETQSSELAISQSSLQAELTRNAGLSQRCFDLELLVAEKDKHIQSLEEKHVQARGALEHYREAVKEQRDQDHRKHESQLHEMQVEQRKLRETIAVKQDESTRLNRDNERLIGESRQQVKTLHAQSDQILALTAQAQALALAEARLGTSIEHYQSQLAELNGEIKSLNLSTAQAIMREAELTKLLEDMKARLEQSVTTPPKKDEQSSSQINQPALRPQDTPASNTSQPKRKGKKP
ncbi:DNA-binding protein [Pseudomonas viridiflava]|uniref:DNA-binding protein n=1 Tax=Pseudomonas syringae group TaxID=136849 RepID=UPI000F01FC58|nr:DNA-binding protein [Pseudomonas viridiflava]